MEREGEQRRPPVPGVIRRATRRRGLGSRRTGCAPARRANRSTRSPIDTGECSTDAVVTLVAHTLAEHQVKAEVPFIPLPDAPVHLLLAARLAGWRRSLCRWGRKNHCAADTNGRHDHGYYQCSFHAISPMRGHHDRTRWAWLGFYRHELRRVNPYLLTEAPTRLNAPSLRRYVASSLQAWLDGLPDAGEDRSERPPSNVGYIAYIARRERCL